MLFFSRGNGYHRIPCYIPSYSPISSEFQVSFQIAWRECWFLVCKEGIGACYACAHGGIRCMMHRMSGHMLKPRVVLLVRWGRYSIEHRFTSVFYAIFLISFPRCELRYSSDQRRTFWLQSNYRQSEMLSRRLEIEELKWPMSRLPPFLEFNAFNYNRMKIEL